MDRRSETRLPDKGFRNQWIAEAAYYQAEIRNFAAGGELDDWLYAENVFEQTMHRRHTLQKFDKELQQLHSQALQMISLVLYQLLGVLQALTEKNAQMANLVMAEDRIIDASEVELDKQVLQILCLEHPVANDLRIVLSTAKIAYELEGIGNELVEVAQSAMALFSAETHVSNPEMIKAVLLLGKRFEVALGDLMDGLKNKDYVDIETLRQLSHDCQTTLRASIDFIVQNAFVTLGAIDLLKIMKGFEACIEHYLDIAKYLNHMNEM